MDFTYSEKTRIVTFTGRMTGEVLRQVKIRVRGSKFRRVVQANEHFILGISAPRTYMSNWTRPNDLYVLMDKDGNFIENIVVNLGGQIMLSGRLCISVFSCDFTVTKLVETGQISTISFRLAGNYDRFEPFGDNGRILAIGPDSREIVDVFQYI